MKNGLKFLILEHFLFIGGGAYESEEGFTNKNAMMNAAKKLQSNNVILKGHPLCWHTVCAPWLLKYDTETIFQKQMERIKREVSDFKGIVDIWDAINEVVILPHFNRYDNAVSRFEKFNLPIHFTENTIVSGRLVPPEIQDLNDFQYDDDASTPKFEEKQKNDMEKFYREIFENHPQVKAITNWDFCDGAWLNAPSGLLRKDNSEKPVYKMLKNLIKNEWWTNLNLKTDKNSVIEVEGFKGKYIISYENKISKKFILEKKDLEIIL